ncbi:TIGR02679 family protein [Sulfidibacter corallicola]|uniref:TIGR02679 family protein n=1 Tax=Sulfidibacter corallicola TaxID=2818388 RepID=A0A8A4TW49_SULCO|nr:TIGR02679 family protein [Sulfidibacter corallicola]QTD53398.1 TIGR02679 family protein [Sulfidibacter corallicola]
MTDDPLLDAGAYFRKKTGLHRFLSGLIDKYRSLGRLGGRVALSDLSPEEAAALSGLLRADYRSGQEASIRADEFAIALAETRFAALDPVAVLGAFAGEALISKKEAKRRRARAWNDLVDRCRSEFPTANCVTWLEALAERRPGTATFERTFHADPGFADELRLVLRALANLPDRYLRLPLFSAGISGDPHAFDLQTSAGTHLLAALETLHRQRVDRGAAAPLPARSETSETEYQSLLLGRFFLVRDDIANFFSCSGLLAYRDDRSEPLPMWRHADADAAVLNVPLRELLRIDRLEPARPGPVFVVENSGIFAALLDGQGEVGPALMCLHGQFKLSGWMALEKLIEHGAELHYSGDFDPEGLLMAQRLIQRFPERIHLWRYTVTDYHASQPQVALTAQRLAKLEKVVHPQLLPLKEAVAKAKCAGYQEALLSFFLEDLGFSIK